MIRPEIVDALDEARDAFPARALAFVDVHADADSWAELWSAPGWGRAALQACTRDAWLSCWDEIAPGTTAPDSSPETWAPYFSALEDCVELMRRKPWEWGD